MKWYNKIRMLKQHLQFKLSQKLSPQQIQLMKLIQLPTQAFEQRLKQELEENPALEGGKEDFANDIYNNYMEFTTGVGFTVKSAKSAMEFNNYHEALHTGIMMQIKKFI